MKATGQAMRNSRRQRRAPSLPEAMLWRHLRGAPAGVRFRHQHAIGPYVADFYCPAAKLVIEIDGVAHDMGSRPERDEARDAYLLSLGLTVTRVAARDVLKDVIAVADGLVRHCAKP